MNHCKTYFPLMGSASILLVSLFLSCNLDSPLEGAIKIDTLYPLAVLSKDVRETSGLIVLNDRVWTFNDSGDKARLYQISMVTGKVQRKIKVDDADNVDWESVTQHEGKIYLGDTGNNKKSRDQLRIYVLSSEELANDSIKQIKPIEVITYRYPKEHGRRDCEAMVVKNNRLFLFTKDRPQGSSKVFSLDLNQPLQIAKFHQRLNTGALITAAHLNGDQLMLLGYAEKFARQPILWVYPWADTPTPNAEAGQVFYFDQPIQAESLEAFGTDAFLISSEGESNYLPRLWSFTLLKPTAPELLKPIAPK